MVYHARPFLVTVVTKTFKATFGPPSAVAYVSGSIYWAISPANVGA
ncbi:hypothetical protein [Planctopirus ephydatiae]|nr:hypothetical protein [Planctopirus ephydatiae]